MNYYQPQPYGQYQTPIYTQQVNPASQYVTPTYNNTPGLNGRFVTNFDEIKPDEIPMNGTQSIFVKNDLSQICVKKWSANGSIETSTFELKQEENKPNIFDNIDYEILESKLNKMDASFSKRLDRLEKIIKRSEDE